MDVILHIGPHRTATTSFQAYMQANEKPLAERGIGFWGPSRTRKGALSGVLPSDGPVSAPNQLKRATGRISLLCAKAERAGLRQLIVSDENMAGAARRNLRKSSLYHDIGARLARYIAAFDGRVTRVVMSQRAQDHYWASVMAYSVHRGHGLLNADELDRLVTQSRSWRDVISDVHCAAPEAALLVLPFEEFCAAPERKLWHMLDGTIEPPLKNARCWLSRSPDLAKLRHALQERGQSADALPTGEGRWQPFDTQQARALRESYADDMYWLRAGADGIADLREEVAPTTADELLGGAHKRGQTDDIEDDKLDRTG